MSERNPAGDWKTTAVGLLAILVLLIIVGYFIRSVYRRFFSPVPAAVSLSAYFVDDSGAPVSPDDPNYAKGHLRIRGDISQDGQPPKTGTVRITIRGTKDDQFRQSISLALQAGHFETEDPAFRPIRPGSGVEIEAAITAPGIREIATINLNSAPPVDKSVLEYGLVTAVAIMAVVFFVAFTGKKTPWKNRTAIIFSYLVIAIFLAVPILAPVLLLRMFPSAVDAMIGMPAGLINTHTANQPENETQWALNIGGYSFRVPAQPIANSTNQAASGPNVATEPGATQASGNTAASTSSSPKSPAAGEKPAPRTSGASTAVPPKTPPQASTGNASQTSPTSAPIVQVYGGLVIPLYVIILSVIGGAINMTRKVPAFQKEGEESDFSLARPISRVGSAVINLTRRSGVTEDKSAEPPTTTTPGAEAEAKPEPSPEEQAKELDGQLEALVTDQVKRNEETETTLGQIRNLVSKIQELFKNKKPDESLLNFNSFEDWASSHPKLSELLRKSWRVELLNQYMYLISAPFLAVVTYYVLDLLGLSKQGVVVVLSFSVGLISERIVSWILGIATGYLRTDTGSSSQKKP